MIRLEQLTMRYRGGAEALSEISLTVESGEFTYLTGPSGAGKTTLVKLLAAIERPTRGQVFVLGRNVGRLGRRSVCQHRRNIGIVFQTNLLLEDRSAFENVALPLHILGLGPREVRRRTEAALDAVGLLGKGSSNGWVLPGRWSTGRSCCSPMSPPETWTRSCRARSWNCFEGWRVTGLRPWWPRMTLP